jgi:hypothetical protein
MFRTTVRSSTVLALIVALASCSEAPNSAVSPSATSGSTDAAADGTTLKVGAPTPSSPVGGGRTETRRPTFVFGPATGRHTGVTPGYRVDVLDANGNLLAFRDLIPGQTSFEADVDLEYDRVYLWRVRAELDGAFGPWSSVASFQAPAPPPPTVPGAGPLPFPVPVECGPGYAVGNRIACAAAVSRLSAQWASCARGSGIGCHRFTRQVAYSLAQSDPAWRMIVAAPGGLSCDCNSCGAPGDGLTRLREDTTSYNGRVFDMVQGAGGPTPSLQWSEAAAGLRGQGTTPVVLCP